MVGEKVSLADAEAAIEAVRQRWGPLSFSLLSPERDGDQARYICFMKADRRDIPGTEVAGVVEEALARNYHYAHARGLGQLGPTGVVVLDGDPTAVYRERLRQRGGKEGVIKMLPLDTEGGWLTVLAEVACEIPASHAMMTPSIRLG
jgi:hypothetical protein